MNKTDLKSQMQELQLFPVSDWAQSKSKSLVSWHFARNVSQKFEQLQVPWRTTVNWYFNLTMQVAKNSS